MCLALGLRVGWVAYRWPSRPVAEPAVAGGASFQFDYPDETLHWQLGTHVARAGVLVSADGLCAVRMPLYPLFLALFAGAGLSGVLAAKLAQAVVGAAGAGIAWWLADRALGRAAGLAAGLLVACDPFGVFFSNLLLSETLFTAVLLGLAACGWMLVSTDSPPACGGDGDGREPGPAAAARAGRRVFAALLGFTALGPVAVLIRPSAAGLVPLLWTTVAWLLVRSPRRRLAPALIICPAFFGVLLLPWGLRNQRLLGAWAWLSTNGGATLYDAQGPQADGRSDQRFMEELPELIGLGEVERDRVLANLAWEQMQRDPGRVIRLAGLKLARMWNPFPNVAEYSGGAAGWAGAAYSILLYTGAVAGVVLVVRQRKQAPGPPRLQVLIWVPVVYFALLHAIYIGSVRYRVPLMPLLAIGAAGWVSAAGGAGRGTRSGPYQTASPYRAAHNPPAPR